MSRGPGEEYAREEHAMPTNLYLAPAAGGKTTYVLARARAAGRDLTATQRVIVPSHLQARAARRRLAEMGGAIGVRVLTFDRLHAEILNAAGAIHTELSEPVQCRLIRAIIDSALPRTREVGGHEGVALYPNFVVY